MTIAARPFGEAFPEQRRFLVAIRVFLCTTGGMRWVNVLVTVLRSARRCAALASLSFDATPLGRTSLGRAPSVHGPMGRVTCGWAAPGMVAMVLAMLGH